MNAIIVCPRCGSANEYSRGSPGECVSCGTLLPPNALVAAERALVRRRPLLLTLFAVFLTFFAGVGSLVMLTSVLGSGPYTINGEPATKGEFLRTIVPMLPVIVAAGTVSFGLWREKGWARPLLLSLYALAGLGSALMPLILNLPGVSVFPGLIFTLIVVALLGWYLYRKENVVEYYRALALRA